MQTILLIAGDDKLENALRDLLPSSLQLIRTLSVEETAKRMKSWNKEDYPLLVLLDSNNQEEVSVLCQKLRKLQWRQLPRLTVIVHDFSMHQKIMEGGADDYLLTPLSQSEIQSRVLLPLQSLSILLNQEETQVYATQAAFFILISQLVGEQSDLKTILSQTLSQVVALMDACASEIWLFSKDQLWLDLISSLVSPLSTRRPGRRAKGQGLIGWVATQGKPLQLNVSKKDSRFDQNVDLLDGKDQYAILAVPMKHQKATIGVLAVYLHLPNSFNNNDATLLGGLANLLASAIYNAQTIQVLRSYVEQQHNLYEMSQRLAAGLDINATIEHSLQWINRLCDAEVSLLWLKDELDDQLKPVAILGIQISKEELTSARLEANLLDQLETEVEIILINNMIEYDQATLSIFDRLQIERGNLAAIPLKQQGKLMGLIMLLNKIGDIYDDADKTLLVTATKMITIAISNARIYEKSLQLIKESERLHKTALQNERLATIGRLTASLAHEINNPMQVIQGALALALEDIHNTEEITEYLTLSTQEVRRVAKQVQRMRQIYHPPLDEPEPVVIDQLLQDALTAAREETNRLNIHIITDIAPSLGVITGVLNQLHLAFLSILLKVAETIGESDRGELRIRALNHRNTAIIEIATNVPNLTWSEASPSVEQPSKPISLDDLFGLSLSRDIILAHGGSMDLQCDETETCLRVVLPQNHS
jgi:transcriptional regulator with GAF, ATPase, and Fis domain